MRTLNRPMFRYGGPIKEGVMSGIREPKRNGGKMLLVGQHPKEFRDASGREKHWIPLLGYGAAALRMAAPYALRMLGAGMRTGVGGKRAIAPISKGVTGWWGRDPLVGGARKLVTGALSPKAKGKWATAGRWLGSPTGALGVASLTDILPGGKPFGPDTKLPNILGQRFDKEGKKIPGTGWFNPAEEVLTTDVETKALTDEEKAALAEEKKAKAEAAKAAREKFAADEKAKRIESYRKIMDIEGMSKDAAYDSLIAASKAVSESGDFKGDIKSGNLINKIIQSTSKAFDKPKATRDAINTLILKGEIEKDIAGAKPGTQYKAASDYASLNNVSISQAYKDLGFTKKGNIAENLTAVNKSLGTTGTTSESLSQAIKISIDGAIPKILANDSKLAEIKKDENFKDTVTLFAETVKEKELGPGIYIIGAEAFQLNEDGSAKQLY